MTAFHWEPDPDATYTPPCPECGSDTEALRVVPQRSLSYLNHIFLCTGEGCRMAWPYLGARKLRGIHT